MNNKIKGFVKFISEYMLYPFFLLLIVLFVSGVLIDVNDNCVWSLLILIVIAPFGVYIIHDKLKIVLFMLNYYLILLVFIVWAFSHILGKLSLCIFFAGNLIYYFKRGDQYEY